MVARIVFLDPLSPQRMEALNGLLPPGFSIFTTTARDEATQAAAIAEADYAISGDVPVTGAMMRGAKQLRGVHKWGVGIDNFDLGTARELGIRIMRTTGSNAVPVAETALAMMMATARGILPGHKGLERGEWLKGAVGQHCFMLSGKTVGIVGLGYIGKSLARLLRGFSCRVLYSKPNRLDPAEEAELGVEHVPFETLLAESDVISLHCALTPQTRGLFAAPQFRAMKKTAVLVNVARGGVVVESDLVEALRAGEIQAACVDVFETEPVPADHPLLHMENVIVTPHIGAAARDNFAATVSRMYRNIASVEHGEPVAPLDLVV